MNRQPAQAGAFYPAHPGTLARTVEKLMDQKASKEKAIGIVAPHAGYVYSGRAAGAVYSRIILPGEVIVLGPNHTGMGEDVAVAGRGHWIMPNGDVKMGEELARKLLTGSSLIKEDSQAHLFEHSIEVQLPFLQFIRKDFCLVPVCISDYSLSTTQQLGRIIARAVKERGGNVLIIASSDMSHYVPAAVAEEKDRMAIEKILSLDPEGLLEVVRKENISMCGAGPVAAMLFAARELGGREAELVLYNTSGDVTGDYDQVVGYAGIIVH